MIRDEAETLDAHRLCGTREFVGIAENGVKEHIDATCFQQDASVTKIAPASAVSIVSDVRPQLLSSEMRAELRLVLTVQAERIADRAFR